MYKVDMERLFFMVDKIFSFNPNYHSIHKNQPLTENTEFDGSPFRLLLELICLLLWSNCMSLTWKVINSGAEDSPR